MKVCDKTCILLFFPIINKYFLMAKRSLLSRCPSYNVGMQVPTLTALSHTTLESHSVWRARTDLHGKPSRGAITSRTFCSFSVSNIRLFFWKFYVGDFHENLLGNSDFQA